MSGYTQMLLDNGFAQHDQVPHFGSTLPNVEYLYRKHQVGDLVNHQYVSLMYAHDESWFLEACFEAYVSVKNTRGPKGVLPLRERQERGFSTVMGTLYRSGADLLDAVAKVYPVATKGG